MVFALVRSMALLLSLFTLLLEQSADGACSTAITYSKGALNNMTMSFGGLTRIYRIWVPANHSDASPLVFIFHGGGGSGLQIREQARFEEVAVNALVVYTDGTGALLRTWNAGVCCGSAITNNVDDIGFVSKMIDTIKLNACVDERRIYAAGMSNGAMLSHRIGCELSNKFAAVAGVAAQLQISPCNPTNKLGVLMIHGFSDSNVPMAGGQGCGVSAANYFPITYSVEKWAAVNTCGCQTFNDTCAVRNLPSSTTQASCTEYCSSPAGPRVQTCFGNWTHIWPRASYADQEQFSGCPDPFGPSDFLASSTIWNFFQQHTLQENKALALIGNQVGSMIVASCSLFLVLSL